MDLAADIAIDGFEIIIGEVQAGNIDFIVGREDVPTRAVAEARIVSPPQPTLTPVPVPPNTFRHRKI